MLIAISLACVGFTAAARGAPQSLPAIFPLPKHIQMDDGYFAGSPRLRFEGDLPLEQKTWLIRAAKKFIGADEAAGVANSGAGEVLFKIDPAVKGDETYSLWVTPSSIEARASTPQGLFWALQTLRQLHTSDGYECARIEDAPRYGWRGVLLDEGRHFMGAKFVKHLLDVMSLYKFNVLHWHLTEDQGWRIEIKSHPELTAVGAWRTEADGKKTGGFYTQEQIKQIVLYAKDRNITIMPEIEMPGHASAAIASIPDLGCTKEQIKVPTTWGVFPDVYCAGRESTFKFLDDVLDEVVKLFPCRYIHIGGDEVPKNHWHDCPDCQARMKAEGLKDEHELQSYFVRRIQKMLTDKGRELVGWDEIMEGGLAKGAVVQVWRDQAKAKEATDQGSRVILSPDASVYLNHPADELPMKHVYSYSPLEGIDHPALIMGVETTLWSERITSVNCLTMFMPRGLAVSEIGWSWEREAFQDFENRVHRHLAFMKSHGIDFGPEDRRIVTYKVAADSEKQTCNLQAAFGMPGLELHYTLDGSVPNESSQAGGSSIEWPAGETLRVAIFRKGDMLQEPATFETVRDLALGKRVTLLTSPVSPYASAGGKGLVDGIIGSSDFHDGFWLGWHGTDMQAVVDLGQPMEIGEIALHCLQDMPSWILMPKSVIFETSNDGSTWAPYDEVANTVKDTDTSQITDWFAARSVDPVQARYVRVTAKNYGALPPWHMGAGGEAFIFADELSVR